MAVAHIFCGIERFEDMAGSADTVSPLIKYEEEEVTGVYPPLIQAYPVFANVPPVTIPAKYVQVRSVHMIPPATPLLILNTSPCSLVRSPPNCGGLFMLQTILLFVSM
jgi:hypothetical protein